MIEIDGLSVRYPRAARPALDGVSFTSRAGALTAVVGPNGSGKSTIVRALLGRVRPSAGTIRVGGVNAGGEPGGEPGRELRGGPGSEPGGQAGASSIVLGDAPLDPVRRRALARRLAVVPQREEPAFALPVRDFIALGRHPHGRGFGGETAADREAIASAAERAAVTPFLARSTAELSGGEWQRVRVARALAQGGEVLVLDEPTTFLDVAHEMAAFELFDALAREGRTVLLVSHQLNLVARFADHIVLLQQGRVAADGSADEVMRGEVLESVYDWPLVVSRDPAVGAPVLVPLRGRGRR
jgi:iron complex transport system ATP-binding protein